MVHGKRDTAPAEAGDVLEFWFAELTPEQWWKRSRTVDETIASRFGALYERLAGAVPDDWLAMPRGRLAAVIVLDQFPRNLFRDDARAYATDARALRLAQDAVAEGADAALTQTERGFLYMPFQHSEDADVQARSVELFAAVPEAEQLDWAVKHKQVIDRFGRFPHRNAVLGRESTPEEIEFLKKPGLFW